MKHLPTLFLAIVALSVAACGVGPTTPDVPRVYDESLESGLTASGGGSGTTCAPGCIWSSWAVSVGVQEATHSCNGAGCACVVEGDAWTTCDTGDAPAPAPSGGGQGAADSGWSAPAAEAPAASAGGQLGVGGVPGTSCGGECVWTGYMVSLGVHEATHQCLWTSCVCVERNNVFRTCNASGGGAQQPDPAPARAPAQPPPPANRPPAAGGDAGAILSTHNRGGITLWNQSFGRFDGADPLSNIKDAAAGRPAKRSCYGSAPCGTTRLDNRLLSSMKRLITDYGMSYFVTAIAGAQHSYGSAHYSGRAVDIDEVNGVLIRGDNAQSRALMQACRDMGATLVLGPSNDPRGHADHVHCQW